MRKFLLIPTLVTSSFAFQIEVGGGPQQEQFRGWIQYKSNDKVDLKNDLHIEDKVKAYGYVDIKHDLSLLFIPIPNLRISYLEMKSSGTGTVSKNFNFGIVRITAHDKVYSKFRFNQLDVTLYYTPFRNLLKVFTFEWGLGAKIIDFKGYVKSLTTGKSDSQSATIPLPYLYGGAEIKNPSFKGFGLRTFGNIKIFGIDNDKYFYDCLLYTSPSPRDS
jgi:outer membrane protein